MLILVRKANVNASCCSGSHSNSLLSHRPGSSKVQAGLRNATVSYRLSRHHASAGSARNVCTASSSQETFPTGSQVSVLNADNTEGRNAASVETSVAVDGAASAGEKDAQSKPTAPSEPTAKVEQPVDPAMEDLLKLVALLPPSVRARLEELPELPQLIEVVMDLGRPPLARFPSREVQISEQVITIEDLGFAVAQVGQFDSDNRAGIDATLHRISCIRNRAGKIIGLTCRAGRAITGSAALVQDLVRANKSILLLGRPGVGKTTAIRDIARMLADACKKRVVIVDTSNEIGGDGDIPHRGIGSARRMQVAHPQEQHKVMIEAVENHMPQVIIIDEISTMAECNAARTIAQRGVQLVATAHGQELENLIKNPALQDLVGGIQSVTLGDESAKKRGTQKSILERAAAPTFDVAIEMTQRERWTVHLDVGSAVDELLLGGSPRGQIREKDTKGQVKAVQYVQRTYVNDNNLDNWGSGSQGLSGTVTYHKLKEKNISTSGDWVSSALSPTPWMTASPSSGTSSSSSADDDLLPKPNRQPGASLEIGSFVSSTLSMQFTSPAPSSPSSSSSSSSYSPSLSAPLVASSDLPEEDKMKVFFVMDERGLEKVRSVVRQLDTERRVQEVTDLEQADVLVASRKQLRNNPKIRHAARKLNVPIYAVKASSSSGVLRDLCPLLGLEPCPVPGPSTPSDSMDSLDDDEDDFSEEQSTTVESSRASSTSSSSPSPSAAPSTSTTCAEDWASLLASTVRELRYQPVDREFATRILTAFLEELPESSTSALATMSWALAYTKNKKRFLESSAGQLQMLADAITPRLAEFKPSELVQVATGFAALKYFPGDEFWDGLEAGSRTHAGKMNEREIKAIQTSFQVLDSLRIMSEVKANA